MLSAMLKVQNWFLDKHKRLTAKVTLPPVSWREFAFSSDDNVDESASNPTLKQIVLADAARKNHAARNSLKSKGFNFLLYLFLLFVQSF